MAYYRWDAWKKFNGTPQTLCKKMFLNDFQEIMVEYGFAYVIPDPNRPGPDYYKDCNEFNWASSLIKSH